MVAFRTEDLLSFSFFEIAPSVKSSPLQNFACPPKNSVLASCLNVTATFFLNDVIFAMKSQAVQTLYLTLFFETKP